MNDNNVSFTSAIRPVTTREFSTNMARFYKNSVDSPWTARETLKAPQAFTTDIYECSAGGITDGENVVMFHVSPFQMHNANFEKIHSHIMNLVDLKSPKLNGFILGCQERFQESVKMFDDLKNMMKEHNIPCTTLKGNRNCPTDILYNSKTDEWLISNNQIDEIQRFSLKNPKLTLLENFDEVEFSPLDEVKV